MVVKFGKYKGWPISEIPLSYLAWIFENLDGKPDLQEAARREIQRRVSGYEYDEPFDRDVLRRLYRTLAMEHHPDKGGNGDIMKGINLFYEAMSEHHSVD